MAFFKVTLAIALLVCITIDGSLAGNKKKRAIGAPSPDKNQDQKGQLKQDPPFIPFQGTKEWSVKVDDNVNGANQLRHEKWHNGTVTGSYAAPGADGKWLKYTYIADEGGFRILSTEEISPDTMMAGHGPAKDNAVNVQVQPHDSGEIKYTLHEDPLKAKKDKQKSDAKEANVNKQATKQ